jgi:hypothetical protein
MVADGRTCGVGGRIAPSGWRLFRSKAKLGRLLSKSSSLTLAGNTQQV